MSLPGPRGLGFVTDALVVYETDLATHGNKRFFGRNME